MTTIGSQITSLTVVYTTVYSDVDQSKHQSSAHWPLCGEFTGTGEFPAQMASYAENVSIWWRHHVLCHWVDIIHNRLPSYKPNNYNYYDKTSVRFALTNDTPYLALTCELWGVFRELYKENNRDISRSHCNPLDSLLAYDVNAPVVDIRFITH